MAKDKGQFLVFFLLDLSAALEGTDLSQLLDIACSLAKERRPDGPVNSFLLWFW